MPAKAVAKSTQGAKNETHANWIHHERGEIMKTESIPMLICRAFFYWLVIVGAIAAVWMFAGFLAKAHAVTIYKNPPACQVLARYALSGAELRDAGLKFENMKSSLEGHLQAFLGVPGSAVKDKEDYDLVMNVVQAVMGSDMPKDDVAAATYKACMYHTPTSRLHPRDVI